MRGLLVPDNDYQLVSALFIRLLALVYGVAFASIGVQITGLAGAGGILPVQETLQHLEQTLGARAYLVRPTLFWFNASDLALQAAAWGGCLLSAVLLLNRWPRTVLVALFVLYLSLFHAGQVFMNFQWDYLLLEAGFLAIFLGRGTRLVVLLLRWLLFRLRFLSGLSKLTSGDPAWSGLTALGAYFETQPLPHWGGWYAHQLPELLLRTGTGITLFVELVVPFMMFMPRRWRLFAAWTTLLMQVLIILTSNHNFFNLLTLVLCLFLFDDRALRRVIPAGWCARLAPVSTTPQPAGRARSIGYGLLATALVGMSLVYAWAFVIVRPLPDFIRGPAKAMQGLHIVNAYHVFPTMKMERIELLIEGSLDGHDWKAYRFRYKPDDPSQRPEIIIPHQPRLDWMMWFFPMTPDFLPILDRFLIRLLENSPAVTQLLAENPFANQPPNHLRVTAWLYQFTDLQTRADTGHWWQREPLGPFYPLPGRSRSAVTQ